MLKKLRCSVCERYLSVLPVKVYPNRVIKCGRCCEDNDGGTESFYNNVVKNYLFKCVNRYEKCNKLLAVCEVLEHEKRCISGAYHCPKCEYKFSGSAFHLLLHYSNQHPKSILRNCNFSVKVKQNFHEKYLHIVNDNLFFVLVENLPREDILYLSTVSLMECKNVKQWFYIKSFKKSVNTTTEVKPCYSLENFQCEYFRIPTNSLHEVNCRVYLDLSEDINSVYQLIHKNLELQQSELQNEGVLSPSPNSDKDPEPQLEETNISASTCIQTIPVKDVVGVKLTEEFTKKYPGYALTPCGTALFKDNNRVELVCSNCKQLTGSNVFNCQSNSHVVCWDCKAWCGICNTSTNGWNAELATMNELLLLPCRWQCGQCFLGSCITQHELSCTKFSRNCPVCTSKFFSLELFCIHLVMTHKNYKNAAQFNLTGYFNEYKNRISGEVYYFQNRYLFKMNWSKKQSVYEVIILSIDYPDHYEQAIVFDNGNKRYNKMYDDSMTFVLSDNPKFYLKRIRNL